MASTEAINIYECFDQNGIPTHYICWGHVDSERFREECYKEYAVRPLIIQHQWQYTRKVLTQKSGKKRSRGRFHSFLCAEDRRNAAAITVGLVPKISSEPKLSALEIN